MKLAITILFAALTILSDAAEARNKDREFKRGRNNGKRGNERSERVTAVTVGTPTYGGNGCPQGTMGVYFSPDYLSFSLLFDQFIAEVTQADKKRDVMACTAFIPMQIPEGMQMEITRVDFRGFVALPDARQRAVLNSVFNFRGREGDRDRMNLRYTFQGPTMTDYEISTATLNEGETVEQTELSPCGGSFQLKIANQLKVVSRPGAQPASATIDSIDGSSNAVYYVNWRACQKNGGGEKKGRF